jgi:aminocarboxymuconate-semialdehyde decarboxylase
MIINWHAHIQPPEQNETPIWQGERSPMRIDHLLDINRRAGVDLTVVTDPLMYLKGRSDKECLRLVQRWNEYAADLAVQHPDDTVFFAGSIPTGGPLFLRELERSIREYGLKGVYIHSSHNGRYLDDERATDFFDLVTELDIPVFLHAPPSGFGEEQMGMDRLLSSLARPFEECASLARMILHGVFDRHPRLDLVAAHLGGGLPMYIGRLDYAYELQEEAYFLGPYEKRIAQKPSTYLPRIHVDSACYCAPMLKAAVEMFGPANVVMGADAPALSPLLPYSIDIVRELPLEDAELDAILSGNALRLLRR